MKKWSLHLKKTVFLGRELYCCHLKIAKILEKSPWDSTAIFIFFCDFSVPSKQCILFEIFLQFSLPTPYAKLKLGKNSGYTRPTLFVGWGEGLDLCALENAPETQKCPKTSVHDCLKKRWEEKRQFWVFFKPVKVFFRDSDGRSWTCFKNSLETNDIHQKL